MLRRCAPLFVPLVLSSTALLAQTQSPANRPAFQFLRQDEDWSRFTADPEGGNPLDRLKHMDLDHDGWAWLSIGGRADARTEFWDGFGFGSNSDSDSFTITRLHLHGDLHLGSSMRVWFEGRTAQATERDLPGGRRIVDVDTFDVYQAFFDWNVDLDDEQSLRLRIGRQSFLLGAQRVVSPLPWVNVFRSWEGLSALWEKGPWQVTALATYFVPNDKTDFNEPDADQALYGVYATHRAEPGGRGYDLYWLGNTRDQANLNNALSGSPRNINDTTGNERRQTIGGRSFGALGSGFDGEAEGAYQFGRIGGSSISAWSLAGVVGYRPADWKWAPRFFTGLDVASGDRRAGGAVGTYHQLFPLGHAYLGFADVIARQNVVAWHAGASVEITKATTVSVTGHVFRLMHRSDDLYGVDGNTSRANLGNRDVGQEIDLFFTHDFNAYFNVYGGYSHVWAGGGIAQSGPKEDQDFFYLGFGAMF
jgi:hypothetical protein